MLDYLKNFGLGEFLEDEELIQALAGYAGEHGTIMKSYVPDLAYLNYHFGDMQFILNLKMREEKNWLVDRIDVHAAGRAIWECYASGANVQPKDIDPYAKRIMVHSSEDHAGMAILNVVNAHVLPSYAENEKLKLQVLAFPVEIDYYKDEDAYAQAQPEDEDGKKWLLADGAIMPTGFLHQHMIRKDGSVPPEDDDADLYHMVRGTVKYLLWDKLEIAGQKDDQAFISCIIDTDFGLLELLHPIDMVSTNQRKAFDVGSTVVALVTLQADAAIDEYGKGVIMDEQHHLMLLRSVLLGEDPERLRTVLADDCAFIPGKVEEANIGADAIIAAFRKRKEAHEENPTVRYDRLPGDETTPDPDGKRCLLSCWEEESAFEIMLIELNEENQIEKIICGSGPLPEQQASENT